MEMRPLVLAPEMVLFAGSLATLLGGSFLPRTRQWVSRLVAAAALAGALVVTVAGAAGESLAFEGTFVVDTMTTTARVVVIAVVALVLALASDELAGSPRESEVYTLLLLSASGALVMAGALDLQVLAVGFLLTSVPLYGLIGLGATSEGAATRAEATMKTYLLGAISGIALLLGVTLLFGAAGETRYPEVTAGLVDAPLAVTAAGAALVVAGLMFKAGGVPAHFWVPDAAQASTGTVAAFLTTVPKVGALVAVFRLVQVLPDDLAWPLLVGLLATASMTLGNLAAYWQTDPRRLLGWSTVSQVGYLLVPVAVAGNGEGAQAALLFYLAGYAVTNVAAFAVTAALPRLRTLDAYAGLGRARPWLASALLVALLGLVGTPPTAVFVGKLTAATAAWDGGLAWLAVVLLVNTVVSLFYYLRWLVPVVRPARGEWQMPEESFAPRQWSARVAVVASAAALAVGVLAGPVWAALA